MAQSKTKNGSRTNNASKANTRFYVVKTVQNARDELAGKLGDYNREYIIQPLNAGKNFMQDLKTEPRNAMANLLNDGKARITHLNKDAWEFAEGFANASQTFLTQSGKNPKETFNELMNDGKVLAEDIRCSIQDQIGDFSSDLKIVKNGIEKDVLQVISDVIDGSKKILGHVAGKQMIEEEISSRMAAISAKFNLPTRKDIDDLVRRVKHLNAKVDALIKAQSA